MTQSWYFSVEQQISPVMVLRAAYVGRESYHQAVGGSSHAGMISGLGNIPPRVMQGALKLTF